MDPTTLYAATQAVSAVLGNFFGRGALKAQERRIKQNLFNANKETVVAGEAVSAQAREQQLDIGTNAARRLSMARVLAAEGVGNLNALSSNIAAGAAEASSRVEFSRANAVSSVYNEAAMRDIQANEDLRGIRKQRQALNTQTFLRLAGTAGQFLADATVKQDQLNQAAGKRPFRLGNVNLVQRPNDLNPYSLTTP